MANSAQAPFSSMITIGEPNLKKQFEKAALTFAVQVTNGRGSSRHLKDSGRILDVRPSNTKGTSRKIPSHNEEDLLRIHRESSPRILR